MSAKTFLNGKVTLYAGDCLDVLGGLPDAHFDSVVTDPPYALVSIVKRFGRAGSKPARDGDVYSRASAGFMGKAWDTGERAFSVEFWEQVMRVLKPGGHVVAFAGTRTYHRLAVAIEDAGFEIRDQIGWLYASGFPKSHDVSKGIEKRRVEDEAPVRMICRTIRAAMDEKGLKSRHLTHHFGDCHPRLVDHWAARDSDSQPALPTWEQWSTLRDVLGLSATLDDEVRRLNDRKGAFGEAWSARPVTGEVEQWSDRVNYALTARDGLRRDMPATDAGAAWQGWGTALKPAWEPIVLARKPLTGTVAENVLEHGTGAMNIDGCRVDADDKAPAPSGVFVGSSIGPTGLRGERNSNADALGRWPANVVHDGSDEAIAAFPSEAGGSGKASGPTLRDGNTSVARGKFNGLADGVEPAFYGDSGSAARFFYSAKADAHDRIGSKHPTVKPVDLMQWLVRLVTPKGGLILDPFAGTGTTGEAAWREGMRAVLIEREEEYRADIARRMRLADRPDERAAVAKAKGVVDAPESLPLFSGEVPA